MILDANPEAVKFADALAASLISVLEIVEENGIPSPVNGLFNNHANPQTALRICGKYLANNRAPIASRRSGSGGAVRPPMTGSARSE